MDRVLITYIIKSRWRLALKTLPYIFIVVIAKYFPHLYDIEFLSLNALFTALISSNIFLIGFLISGTLSDFKESERLPSELASSIQAIADEAYITYKNKDSKISIELLEDLVQLNQSILKWFYKKEKTEEIYNQIFLLNDKFLLMDTETQANFIVRMKNEQNNIRKIIKRIHTIRETSFLGTGYAIAELITFLLIIGLIFVNRYWYTSIFKNASEVKFNSHQGPTQGIGLSYTGIYLEKNVPAGTYSYKVQIKNSQSGDSLTYISVGSDFIVEVIPA